MSKEEKETLKGMALIVSFAIAVVGALYLIADFLWM
jgi:hypothetical protein